MGHGELLPYDFVSQPDYKGETEFASIFSCNIRDSPLPTDVRWLAIKPSRAFPVSHEASPTTTLPAAFCRATGDSGSFFFWFSLFEDGTETAGFWGLFSKMSRLPKHPAAQNKFRHGRRVSHCGLREGLGTNGFRSPGGHPDVVRTSPKRMPTGLLGFATGSSYTGFRFHLHFTLRYGILWP